LANLTSQLFWYYAHECPNIILAKIATYYSQNYAATLGSSLAAGHQLSLMPISVTCGCPIIP